MILRYCELALTALAFSVAGYAQATPAQSSQNQSTYTLHANSQIVLTDITVSDKHGNPVHGLPLRTFRVFDNNKPQAIASFEEHSGTPLYAPQAAPTDVHTNAYLRHLPHALNILLIDIANLTLINQMILADELTAFFSSQTDGQPFAIYLRAGLNTFLVQDFTSDRELLLRAVHKAIPRFPPMGREYFSVVEPLGRLIATLSEVSGRKNVLWFSGGSCVPNLVPGAVSYENDVNWRNLYDALDEQRIALYPIDAGGGCGARGHLIMDEQAEATGGRAFYNNNDLRGAATHFAATDTSFYTLTYSPPDPKFDNKWHQIRVAVDGPGYTLSYHRGYFSDGSLRDPEAATKIRTRLLSSGRKIEVLEPNSHPIIFQGQAVPAADPSVAGFGRPTGTLPAPTPNKTWIPYLIRYTVPIDELSLKQDAGGHQVIFGVGLISRVRDGAILERYNQQVTMTLDENSFRADPNRPITLDLRMSLPKGDHFLTLGVWDMATRHVGSIQIPVEVSKPAKSR